MLKKTSILVRSERENYRSFFLANGVFGNRERKMRNGLKIYRAAMVQRFPSRFSPAGGPFKQAFTASSFSSLYF